MSHTTTFSDLKITNVIALQNAVALLRNLFNINCELLVNENAKMYYAEQALHNGKPYDYVLRMPKSKYDVAFAWDDTKTELNVYYDSFGGHVRRVLGYSSEEMAGFMNKLKQACEANGLTAVDEATAQQVDLSKLLTAYQAGVTLNGLTEQGYTITDDNISFQDGVVEFEVDVCLV